MQHYLNGAMFAGLDGRIHFQWTTCVDDRFHRPTRLRGERSHGKKEGDYEPIGILE
jgi:hypothetical protein